MGIVISKDNKTINIHCTIYIDSRKGESSVEEGIPIKEVNESIIENFCGMLECISDYILNPQYTSCEEFNYPAIEENVIFWKLLYSTNSYGLEKCIASLRVEDVSILDTELVDLEKLNQNRKMDRLCKKPTTLAIWFDDKIYYNALDVYDRLYEIIDGLIQ